MEPAITLPADAQPKDGQWVDTCDLFASITEREAEEGKLLGETVDSDDDGDSGLIKTVLGRTVSEHDRAMEKARALKKVMLKWGVPEVSIELQTGRPNEYGTWDALFVTADMSHHTVSRYGSNLTPVLALCKHGRSDLPGPLCNGYGGWDLCYRIITFGYANHPGEGGPVTVPALTAGRFTIPKDSARRYTWGTEWEGGLVEADWDRVLTNPRNGKQMTFREFMGRSNAALEEYHKIHTSAHLEHSTWTSRKIDRLGYTQAKGIAEKIQFQNQKGDWFDMATVRDLQKAIASAPITVGKQDGKDVNWRLERVLKHLLDEQDRIKALVNEDALAKAIKDALPAEGSGGLTKAQVEQAVQAGIRSVLGSLDNS